MNTAKDPLTGETFFKRRNNQVFANRENQIKYNNIKAQKRRDSTKEINQLLNNNRNILKRVLGGEQEVVKSLDFLYGAGFNFAIITHTCRIGEQKCNCIFDYAYLFIEGNQVKIIKLKN
ncbi:hypothetical protein [Psychroserpens mesophilus]|uniref:hypothetical protein n=1 Tax=Psychroserpens mesophilus TaxID=325473 RepID=UPI00058B4213|nr:hypothetical protein [Psychroserpens mesophilus]